MEEYKEYESFTLNESLEDEKWIKNNPLASDDSKEKYKDFEDPSQLLFQIKDEFYHEKEYEASITFDRLSELLFKSDSPSYLSIDTVQYATELFPLISFFSVDELLISEFNFFSSLISTVHSSEIANFFFQPNEFLADDNGKISCYYIKIMDLISHENNSIVSACLELLSVLSKYLKNYENNSSYQNDNNNLQTPPEILAPCEQIDYPKLLSNLHLFQSERREDIDISILYWKNHFISNLIRHTTPNQYTHHLLELLDISYENLSLSTIFKLLLFFCDYYLEVFKFPPISSPYTNEYSDDETSESSEECNEISC